MNNNHYNRTYSLLSLRKHLKLSDFSIIEFRTGTIIYSLQTEYLTEINKSLISIDEGMRNRFNEVLLVLPELGLN